MPSRKQLKARDYDSDRREPGWDGIWWRILGWGETADGAEEIAELLREQIVDQNAWHAICSCRKNGVGHCPRHRNRDRQEQPLDDERATPWINRHGTSPRAMEQFRQVQSLWTHLTDRQRAAIEARVVYAGNDSEAARHLGIDESTFRAHIRAARGRINRLMLPETPESAH